MKQFFILVNHYSNKTNKICFEKGNFRFYRTKVTKRETRGPMENTLFDISYKNKKYANFHFQRNFYVIFQKSHLP